ncbi:hypothetical protein ACFY9A_29115 [Streptomyces rubradiris]|uniref:hypothetical protein n=1 Tax=Streptomyces rubradiris TaxID=285531 RepID=UPI0036EBA0B3
MATYVVTGRTSGGEPLVSVGISGINQEGTVVQEIDVVNAIRELLARTARVVSVEAQKHEQVITVV